MVLCEMVFCGVQCSVGGVVLSGDVQCDGVQ